MATVRVRKETNKLYFDFKYQGFRCREQMDLINTPGNLKKAQKVMEKIQAEIVLDQLEYARYFPNSNMLPKLRERTVRIKEHLQKAPSFKVFADTWFFESSVAWSKGYREKVAFLLEERLTPYFGEMDIAQIKKADLLQFRAKLVNLKGNSGLQFSPEHINRHMKILRMILAEGSDRYEFNSPFRNIKPLKIQRKEIQPFTLDEVKLIINTVRKDFKCYYMVRFFCGLRTGEIHGLKWKYVDFENRLIKIRECYQKGETTYTKNDSSQRNILMTRPVYEALLSQFKSTGNQEYVFPSQNGMPLGDNVGKRVWHPLLRLLGLEKRSPYQTRHTAATLWLSSGENPEWIARQLGHTNTEMLFRVYSNYVPNLTRKDGSAFEKLIDFQ